MTCKKGRARASAMMRFVEALEARTLLAAVLVKDINTQGADAPSLTPGVELNGTLFFRWTRADIGSELWKSDGTAEGTVLVKDINPGTASSLASQLIVYKGQVYFA